MAEEQTDAFKELQRVLVEYLGDDGRELADWMVRQWESGVTDQEIIREMRNQDSYKKRFPGMQHFVDIGQAIDESSYIAAERTYRQAISTLGPGYKDFYSTDYIGKMMMNDVSPSEATQRVAAAQEYIFSNAPKSVVDALKNQYGMTNGDLVAYMLDPENLGSKVLSDFELRKSRANILGSAIDQGMSITDATADAVAARGYDYGTSSTKMQNAKTNSATLSQLAAMSNGSITDDEVLAAEFSLEGGDKAKKKIKGLASQERARFSKSSGLSRGSLSSGGLGSK